MAKGVRASTAHQARTKGTAAKRLERTEANFELNAVGDLTIAVPVAKGAAAVIRIAGQSGRRVLFDGLRRSGQVIVRETFEATVPRLPTKPKMPPPVKANRFAGVTNEKHINGLKAETKFAHYLHYQTEEIVIRWGDGVGTNGADIISVNSKRGG